MKALRRVLIGFLVLLLLAGAGIVALVTTFDPDSLKPRIEAAIEQSTGRRVTMAGRIGISPSLIPTIVAQDVSVANIEGGSRPAMLRVARIELRLALLPLLSRQVDIRRLRLVEPDILLEATADGRPNWVFAASPRPAQPPPAATAPELSAPPRPATTTRVEFSEILIEGGRITVNSPVLGRAETLEIERLDIRAGDPSAAMQVDGRLSFAGQPFALRAETGHFLGLTGDRPWPYRVSVASALLEAQVEGAMERAAATQDWRGHLRATIPSLAALQPVADALERGARLPAARDVRVDADIAVRGNRLIPRALTVTASAVDLSALREGLSLGRVEFTAPAADQPIRLTAEGRLGETPLSLRGTLGTPAAFAPGAPAEPFSVDLAVQAAGARLTLAGRIGHVQQFGDAALDLAVQVPDLAALSPLAGRPLPALGSLEAAAQLSTTAEGLAGPLRLANLRIVAPAVALEGALEFEAGARPALRGQISGPRLDLDALAAAFAPAGSSPVAAPSAAPAGPAAPGSGPAPPASPSGPAASAPPAAPTREAGPRRVIPAMPIRLDALRLFDADLRLAIAELRAQGTTYRDLATTVTLADGRGRLAPFALTLPGGRVAGTLAADARGDTPALDIALRHDREGLDLAALLAAYRLPAYASGRLEFALALNGSGADLRALLGGASGRVALAMAGGQVERALLATIPNTLRGLILPPGTAENGLGLRCLAFAGPLQDGVLQVRTLLLDTPIGRIGGSGSIRLSNEAIALRLLPDVRLGPVHLRAPVRVAGTLANPDFAATEAATAAAGAAIGTFLGGQRSQDRGLQALGQALGGGNAGLPDCDQALAAVRGDAGPAPAGAAAPAPQAAEPQPEPAPRRTGGDRAPRPADILRGFLGGRR